MVYFRKMRAYVVLLQLFYLVESSSAAKLPDRPRNLAVTVGQRVQMKCEPDNNNNNTISNTSKISEWTIHRPLNNEKKSIWTNWKDATKKRNATFEFDIDEDGSVTINSKSIRLEDAGIYTCLIDRSPKQPERYSAQLIVFESDPQCNTNISEGKGNIKEFDYIAFQCAVNYSGHWTPLMLWLKDGNALNEASIVVNINISNDVQQLSSIINFQIKSEDNGAKITCKTLFIETKENVNKTSARNVPEYKFYCNRTLAVQFGPMNVTITPNKDVYRWQDVLSCKAKGNPYPSYTWRNVRTQEMIADGPQLALNEAGLETKGRHVIECIAKNEVSDEFKQSSAKIDFLITGYSYLMITILTGIICAVLLLIVIIIGRERIKGWIGKLLTVCRRGPTNEPDILLNGEVIQNGVSLNNDFEPYGYCAIPAEMMAVGSAANQNAAAMDEKFPVYAEINKPKNKGACNTYNQGVVAKAPTSTKMSVGRDCTVYEDLDIDGGLHKSEASGSMPQNPMFNKSEYVSIDHTVEPPPPPRPPKRK